MFLLKECKLVARKKKVKVPKEVLTSECRTVPKTECVDAEVRVMVIIIMIIHAAGASQGERVQGDEEAGVQGDHQAGVQDCSQASKWHHHHQ